MNTTERRPHKGRGAQQTGQVTPNGTGREDTDGQLTLGEEPAPDVQENTSRTLPGTPHRTPQSGLERGQENADDWWWKVAMRALKWLAAAPGTFEAYDLTLIGVPDPASQNHWGALFSAAAKAGVIVPAGFTVSRRPTRAGGISRVWTGTVR